MGIYSHPWICHEYCSLCYICHSLQFNTCSQYCFHHRCFVPAPNNAPLPFCSPVEEHLGGWGWTGASVSTDEVFHNLDYRQKHTNRKRAPAEASQTMGWHSLQQTWNLPKWSAWMMSLVFLGPMCLMRAESHFRALGFLFMSYASPMEYWPVCVNYLSFGLQPPTCGASVRSPKQYKAAFWDAYICKQPQTVAEKPTQRL